MKMKKKIISTFFCMLLIATISPITGNVLAGDEENPEIEDILGDARTYLDIEKVWFYENPAEPDMLYTVIKLGNPSSIPLKQHLTIHWEMNGEIYWTMCGVGYYGGERIFYNAGEGHDYWYDRAIIHDITGDFIEEEGGIVTCCIPKECVGNPEPGDVLTKTESQCFERFGLWGLMGFGPKIRESLFRTFNLPFLQVVDFAPDIEFDGDSRIYGKDYVIKY